MRKTWLRLVSQSHRGVPRSSRFRVRATEVFPRRSAESETGSQRGSNRGDWIRHFIDRTRKLLTWPRGLGQCSTKRTPVCQWNDGSRHDGQRLPPHDTNQHLGCGSRRTSSATARGHRRLVERAGGDRAMGTHCSQLRCRLSPPVARTRISRTMFLWKV